MLGAALVAASLIAAEQVGAESQTKGIGNSSGLLRYFMVAEPQDLGIATLPHDAQGVAIAKVRAVPGSSAWLGGRDRSGQPSVERPEYWVSYDLRIVDVIRGTRANLNTGSTITVTFGKPDGKHNYIPAPALPQEFERQYFVVLFQDRSGHFHLAGFPMSEMEYEAWETEVLKFEAERARLPPKDRVAPNGSSSK
ncbi:hypothetical protein UP10_40615 [Bradyrhizobium sp. LTSPM299]|nr:hypothetical protein UP10_40615 [Bradyrhizobium sp. LTSPM299]